MRTPELIERGLTPSEAFRVGNVAEAALLFRTNWLTPAQSSGLRDTRDRLAEMEKAGLTFVALSFQQHFEETITRIPDIISL